MATKKQPSKRRVVAQRRVKTAKARSQSTSAKTRTGSMDEKSLREHVLYVLRGGGAHIDFEKTIGDLPPQLRGAKPAGLSFTAWRLLEHMRIAQWDILEFSRNPSHVSPQWPAGYWPETDEPPDEAAWEKSVREFRAGRKEMEKLVANPKSNLFAPIPHGEGQTLLREALLVADHNAYHLGQLVMLRRLLGAWSEAGTS